MRILHTNMDNITPSGVFTLILGMLEYLPPEVEFDFFGDFEVNEFSKIVEEHDGRMFSHGNPAGKLKKWKHISSYMTKVCENEQYDVVHIAADVSFKVLLFSRAAKRAGVSRIVVHSHNSSVGGVFKGLQRLAHYACRPLLSHYADCKAACSAEAAEWLWGKKLVEHGEVKIIPNGIDVGRFKFSMEKRNEFRRQNNLEDRLVVGHVSNFSYAKNPDYLISIFSEIYKRNSNATLLLLGSEQYKKEILQSIEGEPFYKGIVDLGVYEKMDYAYCGMDAYLMPSLYEGQPVSMLEAAASGLDVWASDTIDDSAMVTEKVRFLPLEIGPREWANAVLNTVDYESMNCKREIIGEKLIGSTSDIRGTLRSFLELYQR